MDSNNTMPVSHRFAATIGNKEVTIETGKLAEQAGGAVTVRMGDTMVFATATMSAIPREGIDFFPLSVDYEEKLYAAGRIPGSFIRREGRPSEASILIARVTDRPLRPLFPKDMRNEVQVIVTAAEPRPGKPRRYARRSSAASAALHISDIPWDGPIGAVRVGLIDGEFVRQPHHPRDGRQPARPARGRHCRRHHHGRVPGPTRSTKRRCSARCEFGARGHAAASSQLQKQMRARDRQAKARVRSPTAVDDGAGERSRGQDRRRDRADRAPSTAWPRRSQRRAGRAARAICWPNTSRPKPSRRRRRGQPQARCAKCSTTRSRRKCAAASSNDGVRPDGRDYTTIRPLSAEVGMIPRAHGSGLFKRGQTQVLSICTLGTPRESQELDDLYPEDTKRYMHHYNFPPFSTGETWFLRGPKRREIGHGALAETALRPMLPPEDEFPYTIRVVSEVLSSNGSTSMASVCGSTLALMDAGVPIKAPGGGHRHGPDQRGRPVRRPDRHPGHGRSPGRHGLQGRRHARTASPPCRWTSRSRASATRSCARRWPRPATPACRSST